MSVNEVQFWKQWEQFVDISRSLCVISKITNIKTTFSFCLIRCISTLYLIIIRSNLQCVPNVYLTYLHNYKAMSQDAGALTTLRWRTCCHLVQRQSTHNRRCLPWHKCRLPQPQIPTPHNTRTQHALVTRPSGPTVPTNNRQDVFANTPSPQPLCPRFYAE